GLGATVATGYDSAPYGYSNLQRPDGSFLILGSDGKPRHPRDPKGNYIRSDELLRYRGVEWSADDDTSHKRINKGTLLTLKQVFALPDPVYLVEGFITEGENIAFVGPPKSGKSFVGIDVLASIAMNRRVGGHLIVNKPGPVIYLSGEGHTGMKRRLRAWCQERGVTE